MESDIMVRLHIGGLGEKATATDVEKLLMPTFGHVVDTDIVRTKCRSFAYVDFVPSSDAALTKLISTYNGCIWKGGKLKLERAKEHYLARLRREWSDESTSIPPCNPDIKPSSIPSQTENAKLRIFFPRLNKVKSLPYKGSGKHKYSFRRTEVPPLPRHFCDCEEHSSNSTENRNVLKSEGIGMSESEVNIMSSVMNKLLGSEKPQTPSGAEREVMQQEGEEEAQESEEDDNLITNIWAPGKKAQANDVMVCSVEEEKETLKKESGEGQCVEDVSSGEMEWGKERSKEWGIGAAWMHGSSWKQLMSESKGFTIGEVIIKEDEGDCEEGLISVVTGEAVNEASANVEEVNIVQQEVKKPLIEVGGEACLFIRSSSSLKEWASIRASLAVSTKRKRP